MDYDSYSVTGGAGRGTGRKRAGTGGMGLGSWAGEGRDRGDGTGVVGRGGPSPVKRPRLRSVANGSTYMCRKRIDVTSGSTDWKKNMSMCSKSS